MNLTTAASSSFIISFPSTSLSYPRNFLWLTITKPFWYRNFKPSFTFLLIFSLSCWANDANIVSITSPLASHVFIFSDSKITGICILFNSRIYLRQSTVFLANRLMDLVIIISIFPAWQSLIIFLNDALFLVLSPEIPSSAYTPANSHSGWLLI